MLLDDIMIFLRDVFSSFPDVYLWTHMTTVDFVNQAFGDGLLGEIAKQPILGFLRHYKPIGVDVALSDMTMIYFMIGAGIYAFAILAFVKFLFFIATKIG